MVFDGVRSFFRSSMAPPSSTPEEARGEDLRLAACALLLELAYADDEFSDAERDHLRGAIRRQFGLDPARADELIELAERERAKAVDLWQFTNLIREHYSKAQLLVLAEVMWGLVYSDGELAEREDYLMRKISNLLDLEVGYLSQARRRARGDGGEDRPAPGETARSDSSDGDAE